MQVRSDEFFRGNESAIAHIDQPWEHRGDFEPYKSTLGRRRVCHRRRNRQGQV